MSETNQLILIACSKSKLDYRRPAEQIYTGDLFKKAMRYSWLLWDNNNHQSDTFILSAKYGLLDPDKIIEPYDETLNNFNAFELAHWARKVEKQIYDLNYHLDSIVFLAGKHYREPLASFLPYKIINPLEGLGIGEQKQLMKNQLDEREAERKKYAEFCDLPELDPVTKTWLSSYGKGGI